MVTKIMLDDGGGSGGGDENAARASEMVANVGGGLRPTYANGEVSLGALCVDVSCEGIQPCKRPRVVRSS